MINLVEPWRKTVLMMWVVVVITVFKNIVHGVFSGRKCVWKEYGGCRGKILPQLCNTKLIKRRNTEKKCYLYVINGWIFSWFHSSFTLICEIIIVCLLYCSMFWVYLRHFVLHVCVFNICFRQWYFKTFNLSKCDVLYVLLSSEIV